MVLYQLITDHLPFDGDNTASTLMKIVSEPPPPLGTFLTSYPPEMEEILLRALAKNPNERYSTAEDMAMDLSQLQGQLKEEMIGQEMADVAVLLEQGEVYKAQTSLIRVLKIDSHHTKANRLLREVQQRIQRDELSKQVQSLRERAEEALGERQFEKALEHVDRGLCLDRNNGELQQLREQISAEAARAEKLHKALKAAESAEMEGNLDAAKEAAEAALALAPNDTQARMLYRQIAREIEERARHQQMEGFLLDARREISSRHFTAAIEILKHAEELEPGTPQIHSLLESAVAGQEQERRRRELEALVHEVEEALNRDDFRAACAKADEGLARFPEDRNLSKLKGLADRQRQIEERKQLIDGLMLESRTLLQAGRHEELQGKLEKVLAQLGPDARLESLLGVVKERLHHEAMERVRMQRLGDARQFIEDQSYDHAIRTLEAAIRESGDDEEVRQLLGRARAEQAEAVQGALARAEQEMVLARRVEMLEDAQNMNPQDQRVREALHQARNLNQVISKIAVEAQKLEEERRYAEALAKWETVSAVYEHYPKLKETVKRLHDLRDQAQASARQGWIEKVERALSAGDYDQAAAMAVKAGEQFPWDNDLMGLQERAENAARARAKALKMLAEGRRAFASQQWDAGSQLMVRAYQTAPEDPLVRDPAVQELAQASRATVEKNWQASELMLKRLAEIEPSAAGSRDLQATIEARKKEETINSALNAARRLQGTGNLQGALRELDGALAAYSQDKRLTDLQAQLQQKMEQDRLTRERETRERAQREETQRVAREKEAREKARREEEQRAARERQLQQREAEAKAARERALEEERLRAQSKPVVPVAEDLSATQIFKFGTAPAAPPADAKAPASWELPTGAAPLPPSTVKANGPAVGNAELPAAVLSPSQDVPPSQAPHSHRLIPETKPEVSDDQAKQGKTELPAAAGKTSAFNAAAAKADSTQLVPGVGSDELTEIALQVIERHLASFMGPLAKILVKREAVKTRSVAELYTILAARLDREEDRKAFLARRTEGAPGKAAASSAFTKLTPATAPATETPLDTSTGEISQAVMEQAARKLAAFLGPIGPLVAKKEAKRASNVREFYEFLAEHVDAKDRERFLKEAGVVKDAPATSFLRRPDGTGYFTKPGDKTSTQIKPIARPEQKS